MDTIPYNVKQNNTIQHIIWMYYICKTIQYNTYGCIIYVKQYNTTHYMDVLYMYKQYNTTQHIIYVKQYNTTHMYYNTIQYNTLYGCIIYVKQYNTTHYMDVLYIQNNTIQHIVTQHNTTQ